MRSLRHAWYHTKYLFLLYGSDSKPGDNIIADLKCAAMLIQEDSLMHHAHLMLHVHHNYHHVSEIARSASCSSVVGNWSTCVRTRYNP